MDCGVYKIDSTYVELPEVPQPFGVVRVNAVVKAFRFIMKQSYICALIAMMVSPASQSFLSAAVLPLIRGHPPTPGFLRWIVWSLLMTHPQTSFESFEGLIFDALKYS